MTDYCVFLSRTALLKSRRLPLSFKPFINLLTAPLSAIVETPAYCTSDWKTGLVGDIRLTGGSGALKANVGFMNDGVSLVNDDVGVGSVEFEMVDW